VFEIAKLQNHSVQPAHDLVEDWRRIFVEAIASEYSYQRRDTGGITIFGPVAHMVFIEHGEQSITNRPRPSLG
jgi:hypothetical protein